MPCSRLTDPLCQGVGARPAYLSFDIDALDPAFAPGTGTPETAGLLPHEVLALTGKEKVQAVGSPVPEQTMQTLKEDVKWAQSQTRSASR